MKMIFIFVMIKIYPLLSKRTLEKKQRLFYIINTTFYVRMIRAGSGKTFYIIKRIVNMLSLFVVAEHVD